MLVLSYRQWLRACWMRRAMDREVWTYDVQTICQRKSHECVYVNESSSVVDPRISAGAGRNESCPLISAVRFEELLTWGSSFRIPFAVVRCIMIGSSMAPFMQRPSADG